ncbi:MAG: hypothetical protein EP330_27520 [Deltaproteobacteria bacterium]|nr:MAG: hypothetical protein EP330_27520 [Deltaproteobacteria bacterium]
MKWLALAGLLLLSTPVAAHPEATSPRPVIALRAGPTLNWAIQPQAGWFPYTRWMYGVQLTYGSPDKRQLLLALQHEIHGATNLHYGLGKWMFEVGVRSIRQRKKRPWAFEFGLVGLVNESVRSGAGDGDEVGYRMSPFAPFDNEDLPPFSGGIALGTGVYLPSAHGRHRAVMLQLFQDANVLHSPYTRLGLSFEFQP